MRSVAGRSAALSAIGAEHGQAAVADGVVVGRLIVDEADQLEAELAVVEDAVRHHSAEIAAADDQHVLQADAGAPAAAQQVAHDFARRVREQ